MATGHGEVALVPILSRGRHSNPRRGACFMEYASLLAGVSWSDHPDCTHPLLALVAREVNDEISDVARVELVPMIPSVIGLYPTDPGFTSDLVTHCIQLVLPVVSPQFQQTLNDALHRARPAEAPLVVAGTIRAVTDFRAPYGDQLLLRLLTGAIEIARSHSPVLTTAGRR
ncbi:hypothetical protein [Kribbella endophytica]